MSKFKIKYYQVKEASVEIEARNDNEALCSFREKHQFAGIESIEYIPTGNEDLKEWYCSWWNGYTWKSKVVTAHNRDEIYYNIKNKLDYAVYEFDCCLNTPKAIDALFRSRID